MRCSNFIWVCCSEFLSSKNDWSKRVLQYTIVFIFLRVIYNVINLLFQVFTYIFIFYYCTESYEAANANYAKNFF